MSDKAWGEFPPSNETAFELYDTVTAFRNFIRTGSPDSDAQIFMAMPYQELFSGLPQEPWVRPTDEQLRTHLLKSWDTEAVDAYFTRRAQQEADRLAREAWEASLRGRITLRYRSIRREASERVRGAWDVLRHGVREEWDE